MSKYSSRKSLKKLGNNRLELCLWTPGEVAYDQENCGGDEGSQHDAHDGPGDQGCGQHQDGHAARLYVPGQGDGHHNSLLPIGGVRLAHRQLLHSVGHQGQRLVVQARWLKFN